MALTHISLDPDAAWREQRTEVERRITAAQDALGAALDSLAALDDLQARRAAKARPVVQPRTFTLGETATAIGIGMTGLNNLIQSGELPSFMQGSRRKVRVEEIDAYLDRQAQTQRAAAL